MLPKATEQPVLTTVAVGVAGIATIVAIADDLVLTQLLTVQST
ncbi:hypothetical protein EMA8858_03657 [Emticicia aquatica]|uniref:Uncharacterized protein n=1 Tax=Emticicia aquatica TaxID=1681835 RepID=A0ABN8EWT5_9BACT|nr:hypothetical protein EMA8858_03657 [Emticicia aquatica]